MLSAVPIQVQRTQSHDDLYKKALKAVVRRDIRTSSGSRSFIILHMTTYYYSNDNFFLDNDREGMFKNHSCYVDYQRGMNYFHATLSDLFATMYVVDNLIEYPDDLLGNGTLFHLLRVNLIRSVVVSLHALVSDPRSYTLFNFADRICQRMLLKEHVGVMERRMEKVGATHPRQNVASITTRLKNLRDKDFAHVGVSAIGFGGNRLPEYEKLHVQELRSLMEYLDDVYEAINIRVPANDLPQSMRVRHIFKRPSQEYNLYELRVQVSHMLNSFSGQLQRIESHDPMFIKNWSNEDLQRLSDFRVKHGGTRIFFSEKQLREANYVRMLFREPNLKNPK